MSHASSPSPLRARGPGPLARAAALYVGALLVALGPARPAAADVLHVYDGLNRLRATVDPGANSAAIWTYDAVGNILSITRQTATQTTILELPAEAIAGACGV